MIYEEENDYIMRMIKEAARVLFSLIFGKKYTQVELPKENKFSVSGSNLDDLTGLVDQGKINEADRRVCRIWGDSGRNGAVSVEEWEKGWVFVSEKGNRYPAFCSSMVFFSLGI